MDQINKYGTMIRLIRYFVSEQDFMRESNTSITIGAKFAKNRKPIDNDNHHLNQGKTTAIVTCSHNVPIPL